SEKESRARAKHLRLKKKHDAGRPADDHPEKRAAGDEIAYALRRQIGVPALGQPEEQKIAGHKRQHISQAIPSRAHVVIDSKNNRIEIVQIVDEHLRRDCGCHSERSRGCNAAPKAFGAKPRFPFPFQNLPLKLRAPSAFPRFFFASETSRTGSAQDDGATFGRGSSEPCAKTARCG